MQTNQYQPAIYIIAQKINVSPSPVEKQPISHTAPSQASKRPDDLPCPRLQLLPRPRALFEARDARQVHPFRQAPPKGRWPSEAGRSLLQAAKLRLLFVALEDGTQIECY